MFTVDVKQQCNNNNNNSKTYFEISKKDMVQVYKILHSIDKVDKVKLFQPDTYTSTRGHTMELLKPRAGQNTRKFFLGSSCWAAELSPRKRSNGILPQRVQKSCQLSLEEPPLSLRLFATRQRMKPDRERLQGNTKRSCTARTTKIHLVYG